MFPMTSLDASLEAAQSVGAIVSALFCIEKAVEKFSSRRHTYLHSLCQDAESQLIATLQEGPQQINKEYNSALCRIGPTFAGGDGI